ncbi:MAG: glutamine synthetase [Actinomycetota bacterium]
MQAEDLTARAARARELIESLAADGVRAVALTMVDNAGVTRVKTVPISRLEAAAQFGIGLSPVFDVFLVNDHITASAEVGGPVGDLRLMPDLDALRPLVAQPGWAWAPTDQYTQEAEVFPCCQRSFAGAIAERAAAVGLDLRMGFEVEWFMARRAGEEITPVHRGPAYSAIVLAEVSDFARDLMVALENERVEVLQFHPEYATGQLEISIAPRDPVAAADENVLLRQTIRGVAARYGMSASFAPVAIAGEVGNGGHVHFSLWEGERNLFAGGDGPHGMTDRGEAFVAGILAELPALVAIGSPSVASYLRLVPSHWSGPWACWGRENREAAIRFVTGMVGSRESAANTEVKCFDSSANPYLVAGALIAAGLAGIEQDLRLPSEVTEDPAAYSQEELDRLGIRRLPQSVEKAVGHLEESKVMREALGDVLLGAFVAVRRAEAETFAGMDDEAVVAAHRWRY